MENPEELAGRHDFDVLILPKVQEVRITRHDVVKSVNRGRKSGTLLPSLTCASTLSAPDPRIAAARQ
jgi:hypothetical protein